MHCLAGDIGGTNARFGSYLFGERTGLAERPTARYASTVDLLADAVAALPADAFDACCLAVAGPVFGTEAKLTNANIAFSAADVAAATASSRVELVNDTVALVGRATAHAAFSPSVPASAWASWWTAAVCRRKAATLALRQWGHSSANS